jgi:hypothetical protein
MQTLVRTDEHRPSVIKAEDYTFVAFENVNIVGFADVAVVQYNHELIREHFALTGGTYANHEHGGNCGICGASAIWTVLFYHKPSNTYIRTGRDCADKLDLGYSDGLFNQFHKDVTRGLEFQAGKRKAEAILVEAGLSRSWSIYLAELSAAQSAAQSGPYEERVTADIVGKLRQYGSISDKAKSYLAVLLTKIDGRAAKLAQQAIDKEAAAPCPSGRVMISGKVVSLKTEDDPFSRYGGVRTKVLVVADSGFKVWGSRFENVEVGQQVMFVATVEVSKNDPKFGFFKRPGFFSSSLNYPRK